MKPTLIFDIEIYRNYFLIMFRNVETGNVRAFEMYDGQELDITTLRKILSKYRLVSFNGTSFDLPLISMALKGAACIKIKQACDSIIKTNLRYWQLERKYNFKTINVDHIDLIEIAPGFASLKMYGGRIGCNKMQDLPIEPDAIIQPDQHEFMREYCANDLELTQGLFETLQPQIALRERMSKEYGMDLHSKSDAQIAEAVISEAVSQSLGHRVTRPDVTVGATFHYRPPAFIQFTTEAMKDTLAMVQNAVFRIPDSGKVTMPKELKTAKITIGNSIYRMGIGGLHSSESSAAHVADDDTILVDRDVASYYPAIILNTGLKPAHMGNAFTEVYRSIVERRLEAKHAGDKVTADSLKITINGSFGKFGSKYSVLYSPTLLIQTTLTGQLSLLMLIEMLESEAIPVVSANTDGIVIKCPKNHEAMLEMVVLEWQQITQFDTEATPYRAIYSRDVNNYIAIKPDGSVKLKGAYATSGLQKNPANMVCVGAVVNHLVHGTSVEETIRNCDDIGKFVTIRTVKGGAEKDGEYLGKAIRWYYSTSTDGVIQYKVNGYKVPRSEGAMPLMEMPESIPSDMNYDWYINESNSILEAIGASSCD